MTEGYSGQKGLSTGTSQYNILCFIFQQLLSEFRTITLARVEAVHASDGSVAIPGAIAPAGLVDVTPLVNAVDGTGGNPQEHGMVFGLPYFRLQGGKNAVILDPEIGDIGIIAVSDRDISSVKSSKDQSNPGSFRRGSFSDGLYLGGFLNGIPLQYVTFTDIGMEIHDKNGNDIITSSQGIVITDVNKNIITTNPQGVVIEDDNKNAITMASTGVVIGDDNKNTITMASTGVIFKSSETSGTNTITFNSSGIVVKDLFGSTITLNSDGMELTDHNGNILTMTGAGIVMTPVGGIVKVNGAVVATGEVTAQVNGVNVSLSTHKTAGVTAGAGTSGAPVPGT